MATTKHQIKDIKLSTKNNKLPVGANVTATIESFSIEPEYAWYVYHNGKIIERIMYTKAEKTLKYTLNRPGEWVFKGFIKDSLGKVVGKKSKVIQCEIMVAKGIDSFPVKEISYLELNEIMLNHSTPTLYKVTKDNRLYEFLVKLDPKSSNLTVLGSGTYDPEKYKLPVFQRFSWMNEIEGNVIFYNDPTLYLGEIKVGWGQGSAEYFPMESIAEIVQIFAGKINVERKNILFYGSSSGGFMSLVLGGYVKGASVLVNNPITDVKNSRYFQRFFDIIGETAYPGYTFEEIKKAFSYKQDIIEFYKKEDYFPNIYCLVNAASQYDMESHFKPFLNAYNQLTRYTSDKEFINHLYWDEEAQHNPLDKKKSLFFIRKVQKMWLNV